MPVGIVDVFEFVQIDHHHGADTDEFGRFAQFVQFIVIIAAVVEPRQNVEIALEFDAPLFDDVEGDIGDRADDLFTVVHDGDLDPRFFFGDLIGDCFVPFV